MWPFRRAQSQQPHERSIDKTMTAKARPIVRHGQPQQDDEPAFDSTPRLPAFLPAAAAAPLIANVIGAGAKVRGDLESPSGFRIEGRVEGTVQSDGSVIIEAEGEVDGTVRGKDIVVHGRVRGNIHASGQLEVGSTGKVIGDISVHSFRMHDGGLFHGTSRMPGAEDIAWDPKLGPPPAGERTGNAVEPRSRTLPPAKGAVPPPSQQRPAQTATTSTTSTRMGPPHQDVVSGVKRVAAPDGFANAGDSELDDAIDRAIG